MNLATVLDMVSDGTPDRVLVGDRDTGLTATRLRAAVLAGAELITATRADRLVYRGPNAPAFPVALCAAVLAGVPFLPVDHRLGDDRLTEVAGRGAGAPLVVTDIPPRSGALPTVGLDEFLALPAGAPGTSAAATPDPDSVAVLLMTSATTAAPEVAVLRHRTLTAHVLGSVELAAVPETDATLVSVPPQHVAAVVAALANLCSGRRIVHLDRFTPQRWLAGVEREGITHALVGPAMLVRIVDELEARGRPGPPGLRSISCGGAGIAPEVVEKALRLFPGTETACRGRGLAPQRSTGSSGYSVPSTGGAGIRPDPSGTGMAASSARV